MDSQTKSSNRLWLILPVVYLILAGVGAYYTAGYATLYRNEKIVYSEKFDFKKRLLDMDEWLGEKDGSPDGENILADAGSYYRQSLWWALGTVGLSILFLGLLWQLGRARAIPQAWPLALVSTALVCLVIGLITPMMEISAFERDLSIPLKFKTSMFSLNLDYTQTFEGDLYFYYQSKSIGELIALLFRQHNFVVGISILLFSVLIPLSKLLLSGSVLLRPTLLGRNWIRFVLEKTGKWSMADVFVVALFLGYLAFNNMQAGIRADSRILIGLYFFLAYCILAIVLPAYLKPLLLKERTD